MHHADASVLVPWCTELQPSVVYIDECEKVFAQTKGKKHVSDIAKMKHYIMQHKAAVRHCCFLSASVISQSLLLLSFLGLRLILVGALMTKPNNRMGGPILAAAALARQALFPLCSPLFCLRICFSLGLAGWAVVAGWRFRPV